MKRLIAVLGIVFAFTFMYGAIDDINKATNSLQFFRGLLWLIVGCGGLASFVSDFKNNEWPL